MREESIMEKNQKRENHSPLTFSAVFQGYHRRQDVNG